MARGQFRQNNVFFLMQLWLTVHLTDRGLLVQDFQHVFIDNHLSLNTRLQEIFSNWKVIKRKIILKLRKTYII